MPAALDKCVKDMLASKKFKPDADKEDRRSSAFAICTARLKKEGKMDAEGNMRTINLSNAPIMTFVPLSDANFDATFTPGVKREIELVYSGKFNHLLYGPLDFNRKVFSNYIKNFNDKVVGRDLFVRLEHWGSSEAAAWIRGLRVGRRNIRGKSRDVLMGEVEYTQLGVEKISSGQYRYFSLEFLNNFRDPETDVDYGPTVTGGAFVNNPFMSGQNPVMLSEDSGGNRVFTVFDEVDESSEETVDPIVVSLSDGSEVEIDPQLVVFSQPGTYSITYEGEECVLGISEEDIRVLAEWTAEYINDLPDSSFAVIEPDYKNGKTKNKKARHLPFRDKGGEVNLAHYKNVLAQANQIKPVTNCISKEELRKKAMVTLNEHRNLREGEKGNKQSDKEGNMKELLDMVKQLSEVVGEIQKQLPKPEEQDEKIKAMSASIETLTKSLADLTDKMEKSAGEGAGEGGGEGDPELVKKLEDYRVAVRTLKEQMDAQQKKLDEQTAEQKKLSDHLRSERRKNLENDMAKKGFWPAVIEKVMQLSDAMGPDVERVISLSSTGEDGKEVKTEASVISAIIGVLDAIPQDSRVDLSEQTSGSPDAPPKDSGKSEKEIEVEKVLGDVLADAFGKKKKNSEGEGQQ